MIQNTKMLKALEIDYEKDKVKVDLSKLKSQNSKVKSMVFEDGSEIDIENLDYKFIKPLIWWE